LFILVAPVAPTYAGGSFEGYDITDGIPSPIPGQIVARPVPQRWDTRCMPVQFSLNTTLDPVPNPLGPAFLSLAEAAPALQHAFDVWNNIPTSYIDMHLTGSVDNPGFAGFDMVNEVTFRANLSEDVIALSFPISFIQDVELVDGDDIDGDGDSDVSHQIATCADVDGDGDIEFPAGFYKAGTIVDSDIEFNTVENRLTIDPAAADTEVDSVDLVSIAAHEFGHSHGLSHTLINQRSAGDGTSATMFPFFDTGDPNNELDFRTLAEDDIALSSLLYPEGSADEGPAALGPEDLAFNEVFGMITGELRHGRSHQPIAGGNVFAVDRQTGVMVSSAFSGTTQLSFDPATGGLFVVDDSSFSILSGTYVLPVLGGRFAVGAEAVDGFPASSASINFTTEVGASFGQQDFHEAIFYKNILVSPGEVRGGIDLVTRPAINLRNFGALTTSGFIGAPPGRFYAVRLPAEQLIAAVQGQHLSIRAAEFYTAPLGSAGDASVVPVFAEALLTTGVVNSDGTASVDLGNPLQHVTGFIGQDNDFAPLFFRHPHQLGELVRQGIQTGQIQNLFLVLQVPTTTPFPGVSALPPLIGLSDISPLFGLSYISDDGGVTFAPRLELDFMFGLVLGEPPAPLQAAHDR
jgi:hypothetical protein